MGSAGDMKRTAIVTGGGTGIGLATAARLAAAGYRVIAAGMDHDELGDGIEFIQTDVTKASDIEAVINMTDGIDALVNCAGIIAQSKEWKPVGFDRVMGINLSASFNFAVAAREKLAAAGGSVVNISSMWGFFGSRNAPAYTSSKAAIVGMTRSLAVAWAEDGIRVNAVAPGWIVTRLSSGARNDPDREAKISDRIPMKRWAEPPEVANVIHFLVSDEASYVTGVVLPIDGGYSIS